MPNQMISQITIPVDVEGTITNVTFDIKDAGARDMIENIGHAVYWMGVTTTAITDGATTNPIQINGEAKTATLGGLASYTGTEFVWNGTAWQEMGNSNLGALAFKSSASGSYQPAGTVAVQKAADTKTSVTPMATQGTLPSMTVSGEVLTFNPGTLPTAGAPINVVSESGEVTATFTGTQTTITVE